jgi:hypothetical protein
LIAGGRVGRKTGGRGATFSGAVACHRQSERKQCAGWLPVGTGDQSASVGSDRRAARRSLADDEPGGWREVVRVLSCRAKQGFPLENICS